MKRAAMVAALTVGLGVSLAAACSPKDDAPEFIPPPAGPITWPPWGTWEAVRAVAVGDDGTVYVGGTFTRMGPMSGGGVPVSADTGAPAASFPKVNGQVHAAVADGAGGWFVGGQFDRVGGEPRENLAHVLADGSLDRGWTTGATATYPYDPSFGGWVKSLAFDGTTLYVAGNFDALGAAARPGLGAVDAAGEVTSWAPAVAPATVERLALVGTTVYLAGSFEAVGGEPRSGLAAVDADGTVTAWNPGLVRADAWPTVSALTVADGAVYVGGFFDAVGGEPRRNVAAVDAATGAVRPWSPVLVDASGSPFTCFVNAFAADGGTLYVGGTFASVDGNPRSGLAAFDRSGALTAWAPSLDRPDVSALAASGGIVYAGGWFDSLLGSARPDLAAFDSSGARTGWAPDPDGSVEALAVAGGAVYVGGSFRWIGRASRRAGLAAIDPDGRLTDWNPGVAGHAERYPGGAAVHALAVVGATILVGGEFTEIGGVPRRNLAAVDASGAVAPWQADVSGPVFALAHGAGATYVGGWFGNVGGTPRANLAALDGTLALTPWNPGANALVTSLAVDGSTVYAGGYFTAVGDLRRTALAAIDAAGSVLPWDPSPSGAYGYASPGAATPPPGVWSLAASGGTVHVSGDFDHLGPTPRARFGAVDGASGEATAFWVPDLGLVHALVAGPRYLVAGGTFAPTVAVPDRIWAAVALVDPGSTASGWAYGRTLERAYEMNDPYSSPDGYAIAVRDGVAYVGGQFWASGAGAGGLRWNLAALDELGNLTAWNPNPAP